MGERESGRKGGGRERGREREREREVRREGGRVVQIVSELGSGTVSIRAAESNLPFIPSPLLPSFFLRAVRGMRCTVTGPKPFHLLNRV